MPDNLSNNDPQLSTSDFDDDSAQTTTLDSGDEQALSEPSLDEGSPVSSDPSFDGLGIDPAILAALSDLGFSSPSPIQSRTIPSLLAGRDVVGLAQTGTGKTAAFGIPMLSAVDIEDRQVQGLVLAPTRELALQVSDAFQTYATHLDGLRILPIYGGAPYAAQLNGLRKGAHIVVGTPGRVIDHLERGSLDLSGLRFLVLDEADEMLTMGFSEEVERIVSETPSGKQVALFSATMPAGIQRLAQTYLNDPEHVTVKTQTATPTLTNQRFLTVPFSRKFEALARILEVEDYDAVLIFCKTKAGTEDLSEQLTARGFAASAINGDMPQPLRERTINLLRNGQLSIVTATDVAARGLDVDRITHVVNYDIAHDSESYVHRIGRTGRAGRTGEAISFITPKERRRLAGIEKSTRQPMTEMEIPSVATVNQSRIDNFRQQLSKALESPMSAQFVELIESYLAEHDQATPIQVAAALAVLAQDGKPFLLEPERRPARTGHAAGHWVTYRIDCGRHHKVNPRQIVGAIANEGGLTRDDFGRIDIRSDYTLIELPAAMDPVVLENLALTRIAGRPINIAPSDEPALEFTKRRGEKNRDRRSDRRSDRRGSRDRSIQVNPRRAKSRPADARNYDDAKNYGDTRNYGDTKNYGDTRSQADTWGHRDADERVGRHAGETPQRDFGGNRQTRRDRQFGTDRHLDDRPRKNRSGKDWSRDKTADDTRQSRRHKTWWQDGSGDDQRRGKQRWADRRDRDQGARWSNSWSEKKQSKKSWGRDSYPDRHQTWADEGSEASRSGRRGSGKSYGSRTFSDRRSRPNRFTASKKTKTSRGAYDSSSSKKGASSKKGSVSKKGQRRK